MTDMQAAMVDFAARQAERAARAAAELQRLKQAVIPHLREAGIARVEVYFDGYGDSGAVEECTCFDTDGKGVLCPDVVVEAGPDDDTGDAAHGHPVSLFSALESLAYLALERHHPGWEINDGASGALVINVAEASFMLDCSLRYTAHEDHSTEL